MGRKVVGGKVGRGGKGEKERCMLRRKAGRGDGLYKLNICGVV